MQQANVFYIITSSDNYDVFEYYIRNWLYEVSNIGVAP
jgi:hypothetical protein